MVLVGQVRPQGGNLPRVVNVGGLRSQQRPSDIAQPEQRPQLPPLGGRDRAVLEHAVIHDAERVVIVRDQVPIPQTVRGQRHRPGLALRVRPARRHLHPVAAGRLGDAGERNGQARWRLSEISAHVQGPRPVHTVANAEVPEDPLGVVIEIGVHPDDLAVDLAGGDRLPQRRPRWGVDVAAAEHQQVRHHLRTRRAPVRPGRQPDRGDQVSQGVHLPPRGRVLSVQGEMTGQQGDEPARAGEGEGLDDEVVVQRVGAGVVTRVVQADITERDVPDDGVEVPVREAGSGERLRPHLRTRIQRGRDRGADRVQLHPGHTRRGGSQADEPARAAARLQHLPAGEPEAGQQVPHRLHVGRIGVVGVDRRAARRRVRRVAEHRPQVLALGLPPGILLVEQLRHRTPARPARQHATFGVAGRACLPLEPLQHGDRVEVHPHPRPDARRREIVLPGRPERCYVVGWSSPSFAAR
nr:hypothetical protein [Jiangella aurantiaca]